MSNFFWCLQSYSRIYCRKAQNESFSHLLPPIDTRDRGLSIFDSPFGPRSLGMAQFMDLPPEVRVQIYRMLVYGQIYRKRVNKKTKFALRDCHIHQVSSRIQQEALPLLYSENEFHMVSNLDLTWLHSIGRSSRDSLHQVTIFFNSRIKAYSFGNDQPRMLFSLLAQCPNLSLTVRTTLHDLWSLDGAGCEAFANMHGFLEASAEVLNFSIPDCFCRDHAAGGMRRAESDLAQPVIVGLIDAGLKSMTEYCPRDCLIHQGIYKRQTKATIHFKWGYFAQFWAECIVCDFQHFRYSHRHKRSRCVKSSFTTWKL